MRDGQCRRMQDVGRESIVVSSEQWTVPRRAATCAAAEERSQRASKGGKPAIAISSYSLMVQ